ncbi:MAG: axeA, partial [Verrucomicrobiales bacterium]|nr:axeA [Verrucomicrobiales bacterium]
KIKPVPLSKVVNAALNELANNLPITGCASANCLKDKGDELHFDAPSQREFGKRYAEIMSALQHSASHK